MDGSCVRADAESTDSTAMDNLTLGVECKRACANDSTCALAEMLDDACYHKLFPDGVQAASYSGTGEAGKKCYVPITPTVAAEEYNWVNLRDDIPDSYLGTLTTVEEMTLNSLERITGMTVTTMEG